MENKKFKLRETSLPQQFKLMGEQEIFATLNDGTQQAFTIGLEESDKDHCCDATDSYGTFFMTVASLMSRDELKPKEAGKAALTFTNYKGVGEVIFACIAEYIEDGNEGNWYYSFTFNPDDIKGIKPEHIYNFTALEKVAPYSEAFNSAFLELHSKRILDVEMINQTTLVVIKTLYNWLDTAAEEGVVVELDIDDVLSYSMKRTEEEHKEALITFATLSVSVEKGVKVMSGQFGEELKAIAKGNGDSV